MATNAENPRNHSSGMLVEISAAPSPIESYAFLAVSADVVISGFFVDIMGRQCSAAFAITATSGAAVSFQSSGIFIPQDASGFVGKTAGGDLYFNTGCALDGTLSDAYPVNANCPIIAVAVAGNSMYLGRVAG
jgi:hypothetical protein